MTTRIPLFTDVLYLIRNRLSFVAAARDQNLVRRFATGTAWAIGGTAFGQALVLISSVAVARLLGQQEFGKFGIVQNTVTTLGVFAGFGLGTLATKHVAEFRASCPKRIGAILSLCTVTSLMTAGGASGLLILFARPVARIAFGSETLALDLRVAAALLFTNALMGASDGVLVGFERFRTVAKLRSVRGGTTLIAASLGALFLGRIGALAGYAIATAAALVASTCYALRETRLLGIRIRFAEWEQERKLLLTFAVPSILAASMVGPVTWIANTLLVKQPNGYNEFAVFNAANYWRLALSFVPLIVSQVGLPILSNLYGGGETQRYRKTLWLSGVATAAIVATLGIPVMLLAPYIMAAYGKGFQEHWAVLPILILATILSGAVSSASNGITTSGNRWWAVLLNGLWAVVFLGSALYAVPRRGALGLAVSYAVGYCSHLVTVGLYTKYVLFRNVAPFAHSRPPSGSPCSQALDA